LAVAKIVRKPKKDLTAWLGYGKLTES